MLTIHSDSTKRLCFKCFIFSISHRQTPQVGNFSLCLSFSSIHKKGVGVCFSAHPGFVGSRIASPNNINYSSCRTSDHRSGAKTSFSYIWSPALPHGANKRRCKSITKNPNRQAIRIRNYQNQTEERTCSKFTCEAGQNIFVQKSLRNVKY